MSCIENTEVYIPQEASITTVPVQALPRSIRKKVLTGPLHLHGDQPATFITPVELRGIGTTQNPSQLPLGQNRLPVVTSNLTALLLIKRLVHSGEISLQFSEPRADRLLYNGRNSIVVYDGKLFLSVRKKRPRDWPMDPPSSTLPEREAPPPDSPENLDGGTDDVIDSGTSGGGTGEAKDHGKCIEDAQEEANDEPTEEEPEAPTPTRDVSTNTISLIAKIKQELDRENQLAWAETSAAGDDREDDHANAECLSGRRQISQSYADELSGDVAHHGNRVNKTNADAGNAERRSDRTRNAKMFRGASDDANQSTENVKSGDEVLETLGGKNVPEKANSNGADAESCVKTKLAEANRVNSDVEIADAKTSSKLPINISDDVNTIVTSTEHPVYAKFSGTESQSDKNKRCEDVGEIAEASAGGLAGESQDTAAISQTENRPGKTEGGESHTVSIELVSDKTGDMDCVKSRSGGVQGSLAHDDVLNSPDDVVEVGESRVESQTSRDAKSAGKLACRKRLSFGNAEEKLNSEPGDDLIMEERGAKATSSVEIVEIDDDDDRVCVARKNRANAKRVRFKDEVVECRDTPAGSDDVIIIDDDEQNDTDVENDDGDEVEIVELAERQAESRGNARSGDAEESPAKMNASKRKISNSGNDSKSSVKSQISEVQSLAAKRFKQNDSDYDEERKDRSARASETSDDSSSESELVIDLHRSDARPPGQVDANMEDLDIAEADDDHELQDVATVERSANEKPRVHNQANEENDEIQREKNYANGDETRAQNDTNETGSVAKASGSNTESLLDKLRSAVANSEAQTSSSSDAEPMEVVPDDLDVSGAASYANEETFASSDNDQADASPEVSISGVDVEENVSENQSAAAGSSEAANQSEAQQGACVQADLAPPPADGGSGYAELNRQENITLLRRRLRGMEDKLNAMINRR
ncbi:uncharacterized protein si:dkeyp-110g5.4 isoform X2 [Trichomycterus rosablanca]